MVEAPLRAQYPGCRVPCGGGAYFRLMPYRVYRKLVQRSVGDGQPLVFYIHPWEFDEGMPRVHAGVVADFRHYTNAGTVKAKLEALLQDLPFTHWEPY